MKVRSSETNTNHLFAKQMFQALQIGEVQGLLINAEGNFSCCVEYIEYEKQGEHFSKQFTHEEWWQKKQFAIAVGVPFYVVVGNLDGTYNVYEVFVDENNVLKHRFFRKNLDPNKMAQQWAIWKGTRQVKELTEASIRVRQTRIDAILEAAGLQWGGNIDGFINNESVVRVLIECRYPTRSTLEEYDPQNFFFGTRNKSGDYGTWLPLIKLKEQLGVPLVLICFQQPVRQACSIAEITGMNREKGLSYKKSGPTQNVFDQITEAVEQIKRIMV